MEGAGFPVTETELTLDIELPWISSAYPLPSVGR
jgi:hypothetical protein